LLEFCYEVVYCDKGDYNTLSDNLDWQTLFIITLAPVTRFLKALIWLFVVLLCREVERTRQQGHFLDDIRESPIQLVDAWQGDAKSEPEAEVVDRMVSFIEYVAERQKPSELLVWVKVIDGEFRE
jgi:hypothetical protein